MELVVWANGVTMIPNFIDYKEFLMKIQSSSKDKRRDLQDGTTNT
jgi:hypothetical protein